MVGDEVDMDVPVCISRPGHAQTYTGHDAELYYLVLTSYSAVKCGTENDVCQKYDYDDAEQHAGEKTQIIRQLIKEFIQRFFQ